MHIQQGKEGNHQEEVNLYRHTCPNPCIADLNGRTNARDAAKLLERIKQLEGALAQAHDPQNLLVTKTTSSKSHVVDRGFCHEPIGTDEQIKGGATQDFPLTRQVCQPPEDGIYAHITFATRLFGKNWYHRGMPIFSEKGLEWIASRTGQSITTLRSYLARCRSSRPCWNYSALEAHTPIQDLWELPAASLVKQYFGNLSNVLQRILFPILDRVLFEETINTAHQSFEGMRVSHTHISARACLWAAFAVMAHLNIFEQASSSISSKMCAARAQGLLELVNGPANLDTLQTMLLLVSQSTQIRLDLVILKTDSPPCH